jgi:zinc protease
MLHNRQPWISVLALLLVGWAGVRTPAAAAPVRVVTSPGGINAWLVEEHGAPLLALRFAFPAGATAEPDARLGLANMLAETMSAGAGDLDAAGFRDRVARLGLRLGFSAGRDAFFGRMDVLTKHLDAATGLIAAALQHPRFDEAALDQVRARLLADRAEAANEPRAVAYESWYATAFAGQPYGRPAEGTPETLRSIGRDDLADFHRRLVTREDLAVVAVGDIAPAALGDLLDRVFGPLPNRIGVPLGEPGRLRSAGTTVTVPRQFPGATALFGLPALGPEHADYTALLVLNHVLGSGQLDARLSEEVRVRRGLAYAATTNLLADRYAAFLLGELSAANENVNTAIEAARDVLRALADSGPTAEEVERAKAYLTGSFVLSLDAGAKIADTLLSFRLDGRPPDYVDTRMHRIEAVSLDDVKRVARDLLRLDRLIVTIVGLPAP